MNETVMLQSLAWAWFGVMAAYLVFAMFHPDYKDLGFIPRLWHVLKADLRAFWGYLFRTPSPPAHSPALGAPREKLALSVALNSDCKLKHEIVASELNIYNEIKSDEMKDHALQCEEYKLHYTDDGTFKVVRGHTYREYVCEHDPYVVATTLDGIDYLLCAKCGNDMGSRKAS